MCTSVNPLLRNSKYSLCKELMSNLAQILIGKIRLTIVINGQHNLTILQWHSTVEYHFYQELSEQNGMLSQIRCGRVRLCTIDHRGVLELKKPRRRPTALF
jgi:hypothetical protein